MLDSRDDAVSAGTEVEFAATPLADVDYRVLFEQVPTAVAVMTPDLRIVAATDAYMRYAQMPREDLVGRTMDEAFPDNPEDDEDSYATRLRQSLLRVRRTGEPDTLPMLRYEVRSDGLHGSAFEERYWSVANIPVHDAAGELEYVMLITQEITDLVAGGPDSMAETDVGSVAVEQFPLLHASLRQLEEALRRLELEDERKRGFLAVASHELRTPLTAIAGFVDTLLYRWHDIAEEQRLEFLHIVDHQTNRLVRIVEDVLTLSQIENGALQPVPRRVHVKELLEATIHRLGDADDVELHVDDDLVGELDPNHLEQATVNFLSNARKYGAPPIAVEAHAEEDGITLSVADAGPGVDRDFVPHLFEAFARADRNAPSADGSGLGLSIVRRLAESSGGSVWYEPNRPVGARFQAHFRAVDAHVPPDDAPDPSAS